MISLDLLTSAASGSANAYGGQNESQSNGWLLELERAWLDSEKDGKNASQSRADAHADSSNADADQASTEGQSGDAMRAGMPSDTTGLLSAQSMFSSASASSPQFDSRVSAIFASLTKSLDISSANQPLVDGQAAEASDGAARTGSTRSGSSEKSPLSHEQEESSLAEQDGGTKAPEASTESDASYPEKRLHLLEDEHGVRIWIRDAALSEERGHVVANALRSELGTTGLRVVSVALNGKEISGHGESRPESEAALSEQDADYVQSMIDESNPSIEKLSQKEYS